MLPLDKISFFMKPPGRSNRPPFLHIISICVLFQAAPCREKRRITGRQGALRIFQKLPGSPVLPSLPRRAAQEKGQNRQGRTAGRIFLFIPACRRRQTGRVLRTVSAAVLSGIGIAWFPELATPESMQTLRNEWKTSVFRIAMYSFEGDRSYIRNPEWNKTKVCSLIDAAIELDQYVIVDWHILADGNPQTYQKQAAEFFTYIASKYAGVPNLLYEICNELFGSRCRRRSGFRNGGRLRCRGRFRGSGRLWNFCRLSRQGRTAGRIFLFIPACRRRQTPGSPGSRSWPPRNPCRRSETNGRPAHRNAGST